MDPSINVEDAAAVAAWEAGADNVFRSKIEVVDLGCFRDALTGSGHPESKPTAIEVYKALDSGVAPEQAAALAKLRDSESELYAKLRAAVYRSYQDSYEDLRKIGTTALQLFGGDGSTAEELLDDDADMLALISTFLNTYKSDPISEQDAEDLQAMLPRIVQGDELDGLVSFSSVSILLPHNGSWRIGVVLDCPWTDGGMGLIIENGEVTRVGNAYAGMDSN